VTGRGCSRTGIWLDGKESDADPPSISPVVVQFASRGPVRQPSSTSPAVVHLARSIRMSQRAQSFRSHARWFTLFHFVASPILLAHLVISAVAAVRAPGFETVWQVVLAFGLVCLLLASRLMALRVQDRVIRLEERLRIAQLVPELTPTEVAAIQAEHLIGLRFASDEEVPELVARIRAGDFESRNEVKAAVRNWRPDHLRA